MRRILHEESTGGITVISKNTGEEKSFLNQRMVLAPEQMGVSSHE